MPNQNKNLTPEELLQKIYESTEKTRKYILWGRIMSLIYLILILAPIIWAIVYLPPILDQALKPYQEILNLSNQGNNNILQTLRGGGIDLNQLLKVKPRE